MSQITDPICKYCDMIITKKMSTSTLECGHIYHTTCLHQRVAHMYSHCPSCVVEVPSSIEGFSNLLPLNFGDDYKVNCYLDKWAVLDTKFSLQKSYQQPLVLSGMLDTEYKYENPLNQSIGNLLGPQRPRHTETSNRYSGNGLGKKIDAFFSSFMDMEKREKNYGIAIESDPCTLIGNRTPSHELRFNKGIDFKTLMSQNISLLFILSNGYTLLDFTILGATLQDLMELKFDANIWKKFRQSLPYDSMIKTFGLNFFSVFTAFCQNDIKRFGWLEFSLSQLVALNTSMSGLIHVGFVKSNFNDFPTLTMQDWKELGLDKKTITEFFKFSKNDLIKFRWCSDLEKDQSFKKKFYELFFVSVDSLS